MGHVSRVEYFFSIFNDTYREVKVQDSSVNHGGGTHAAREIPRWHPGGIWSDRVINYTPHPLTLAHALAITDTYERTKQEGGAN